MKQYADLDFSKAAKILNVLIDPVAADDTGLGTGQMWFNTSSKFFKGYDGTTKFSLLRDDLAATITGVLTFNPGSGNVPFAVHSSKTDVVTNLNADQVDGYNAVRASATEHTCAVRDTGGVLFVATPTLDGHAATKAYVDNIAAGQDWKDSCRVATTANITLSGTQTIDGVAVVADDRVLVKDQTTASENGIYVCAAGSWSRSTDSDENAEVTSGLTTFIEEGTDNAGAGYTLTTTGSIVVGTTSLAFTRTSGGSVYSAGNGIVKSGTAFHFGKSSSYSVGAIPYADSATTISFITAVAAGKLLKSNGENTIPQWGSLDLTADVGSSILPVANGGTGTDTQFSQGSVIFAGANGVYSEDSTGLYFDAANNRLGVNTSPGAYTLDVAGTGRFSGQVWMTANSTHQLKVSGWSTEGAGASAGSIQLGNSDAYCGRIWFDNSNTKLHIGNTYDSTNGDIIFHTRIAGTTVDALTIKGDGKFGLGISAPSYLAHFASDNEADLAIETNQTGGNFAGLRFFKSRGTNASKSTVANGDTLSQINYNPYVATSGYISTASIRAIVNGTVTGTAAPTDLVFFTGTTGQTEALRINSIQEAQFAALVRATGGFISEAYCQVNNDAGAFYQANTANSKYWRHRLSVSASEYKWIFDYYNGTTTTTALTFNEDATLTVGVLGAGSGNSVVTQESGLLKSRTINTGVWTGNTLWHSGNDGSGSGLDADTVDGYQASALLDLANSTGDTDDISEGLTNLFYTDARARGALSSAASAQIAYNSLTGVIGLGTEAGRVKDGSLGAGASPTFTHNLGTRNIVCQVFRTASPYDEVRPEIKRTDTNTVTVEFIGITPTAGEFTIVCMAKNG